MNMVSPFNGTRCTRDANNRVALLRQRSVLRLNSQTKSTGLCSYRVRGVGGSRAEHLTVESYTIIISLQSYLLLLVFHHPLTLSL